MVKRIMELECIKESKEEGFVLGERYKMISNAGRYLEMENSLGLSYIMTDEYFRKIGKR